MFANDVHGDCVIAARAHLTLRFEDIEQGSILMIKDQDVLKEYFKESGGADHGLNILDSLNEWAARGLAHGPEEIQDPRLRPGHAEEPMPRSGRPSTC